MSTLRPGTCRHCGCTEDQPCTLHDGDKCVWTTRDRLVCSNQSCINAEAARYRIARAINMLCRQEMAAKQKAERDRQRKGARR